jgi:hypothetical protein
MTLKKHKINLLVEHPVVLLLKSFSEDDLKKFRRFLESPYFNTSKKVIDLFDLLCKFYPDFKSKLLNKETLYFRLHKDRKTYVDSTMRDLLSELLELMQRFLTYENFELNCPVKFEYLSTELNNRQQSLLIYRLLRNTRDNFQNEAKFDTYNYYALHRLNLAYFNAGFTFNNIISAEEYNKNLDFVKFSTQHLFYFFISEYISEYINMVFYSMNFNVAMPKTNWLDLVDIKKLEKQLNKEDTGHLAYIYLAAYNTFHKIDNFDYYLKYKEAILKHQSKLNKDELYHHFLHLINYLIIRSGSSDSKEYDQELLNLYMEFIENDYYKSSVSVYLQPELFRNMVLHGLAMKRFNWVDRLILISAKKLPPDLQDDMRNLAIAYLNFEKNDYYGAWHFLTKIKSLHYLFKYDIRNLALRIYYELGQFVETLNLIQNYRKFLQRTELISDEQKNKFANHLKYLEQLVKFRLGEKSGEVGYYINQLNRSDKIYMKDWLLDKYTEYTESIRANKKFLSQFA